MQNPSTSSTCLSNSNQTLKIIFCGVYYHDARVTSGSFYEALAVEEAEMEAGRWKVVAAAQHPRLSTLRKEARHKDR